ncbi:hypothetical protein [Mucilaginibacter dorajii]|uniref:Phosphodiester glycosidase domain-containing protein n=1 Tax=Mucilaginibacter dorajii TaxID=692994 RepID=A0ABP7PLM5_9SPHI|nr:hypothetical protein [Mucilaginibacter dorajii]MCS3733671.1 hypothetical protein [Mucilaginibacter dorajii]
MMKVLLAIIGLFISLGAIAQQRDSIYISGGKLIIQDATTPAGKAYVEVDGKVFTGKLSSIKPADIKSFSVIKPNDAKNTFGASGANGVYFIKTNAGELADMELTANDSLNRGQPYDHSFAQSASTGKANMYVINGEVSTEKKLQELDPGDIISIDILKNNKNQDPALSNLKGNVMAVITKPFAIKQYRQKLGRFSKEYKAFLDANSNDDSRVVFLIDGTLYSPTKNEGIKGLFQLNENKIHKVSFSKGHEVASGWKPAVVIITTK